MQAGKNCLAKSVLSSQSVYLLTVLKPSHEVLVELDKTRKISFGPETLRLQVENAKSTGQDAAIKREWRPGNFKPG
jgi:hypothetical protein